MTPQALNRAGFLADAKNPNADLAALHTQYMTASERALVDDVKGQWATFFEVDNQIVDVYLQGTKAAAVKADAMTLGPASDVYYRVLAQTDKLTTEIQVRSDKLAADAERAASVARTTPARRSSAPRPAT